jgi:hypothetical protein
VQSGAGDHPACNPIISYHISERLQNVQLGVVNALCPDEATNMIKTLPIAKHTNVASKVDRGVVSGEQ